MSRTKHWFRHLGWAAALLALAGCPFSPTLDVQPLAVSFGSADAVKEIRVTNGGMGTLAWQASENLPWLELSLPAAGAKQDTVQGTTTSEIDVIQLTVNRSALPLGVSTGEILITSNGGEQSVAVSAAAQGAAQLQLSTDSVDFGVDGAEVAVQIANAGTEALTWTFTVPAEAPWLSATPANGGVAVGGAPQTITLRASRTGLAAGVYFANVAVASNGGDTTILARMEVPPFSVLPPQINFGSPEASISQVITVSNGGFVPVPLTLSAVTDDGAPWLSVSPTTPTLPGSGTAQATVTANPAGLAPGSYAGHVTVAASGSGYSREIPVAMIVTGFSVAPTLMEFGALSSSDTRSLTLQNLGPQPIPWSVSKSAGSTWLDLSKTSGTLAAGDVIQVTANPAVVQPGAYEAVLTFSFTGGEREVTVRMTRPRPPGLRVEPNNLDFGATRVEDLVGLWNDGTGTVNWRIDTAGFPAWLVLTPVDGGGIASGSVSGETTDTVTIRVDRSQAPAGQFEFEHSFVVEASGDSTAFVTVTVHMSIAKVPVLTVKGDEPEGAVAHFVNVDEDEDERPFFIRNDGTGPLFWSIDITQVPAWITSITPAQGSLDPGTQQTVTVAITREGLNYLGAQFPVTIVSNDPAREAVPLLIEVQVPKKIVIGATPASLAFGLNDNSALIAVANLGDPDTLLNFKVTPSKDWLSAYPDTGASLGVVGEIKDWQTIGVSVDRTRLDGRGASAKLVISAFDIVGGVEVPRADVTPFEINVSVQAAGLTIETALPRLRVPSLVRFVLLMRNVRYEALPIPESFLDTVGGLFAVYEKNVPLELSETNQFLTSPNRIRGNALILLDYSGSMQEAAHQLTDDSIVSAPDRLQAVYQQSINHLIEEIPSNYRIGIALFNERGGEAIRVIRESAADPVFTDDRTLLLNRLNTIQVADNGATQLLPAINAGALELANADWDQNLIPFDDADVRALICVTDGRLTTPPGNLTDTVTTLQALNTRLFCVGWGDKVLADPLIRLTTGSGGHFYSTRNEPTGELDPFGSPIRVPVFSELDNWCATNLADACDQSISRDLASQTVFSYTTLSEEANVGVEGRITFNDPNDQASSCLLEQGDITGRFAVSQLDFLGIAGDPRLGQISLRSSGIQPDGTATLMLHADYMPRNVSRLSFRIETVSADPLVVTVRQPATTEGGIISQWVLSGAAPVYTFTSPDAPLRYGEFGDLAEIRFQGATAPFRVNFTVLDPVYSADPNSKYFTCPDTITVTSEPFLGTSFPSAFLSTSPAPVSTDPITLDLGTTFNSAQVRVYNLGGHHSPSGAWLNWQASTSSDARFLSLDPLEGGVSVDTLTPSLLNIIVDRSIETGDYEGSVTFEYSYGSLGLTFTSNPIIVRYHVLGPELTLSATTFNFDATTNELPLTVTNTGQGTMGWAVNTAALPAWLSLTSSGGTLGPGEGEDFLVRINRANLPGSGIHSFSFAVNAEPAGNQVVNVTVLQP